MDRQTRKDRNIQRAANAAHVLLSSSTYRNARKAVEEALLAQLKALDLTQRDEEHEVVQLLRASELFHSMMEKYVSTGDVVAINKMRNKQIA